MIILDLRGERRQGLMRSYLAVVIVQVREAVEVGELRV